jgi:hypothetical protein
VTNGISEFERLNTLIADFKSSRKSSSAKPSDKDVVALFSAVWSNPDLQSRVPHLFNEVPPGIVAAAIKADYATLPQNVKTTLLRHMNAAPQLLPKMPAALLQFEPTFIVEYLEGRVRRTRDGNIPKDLAASLRAFLSDARQDLNCVLSASCENRKIATVLRALTDALLENDRTFKSQQAVALRRVLASFQANNQGDLLYFSGLATKLGFSAAGYSSQIAVSQPPAPQNGQNSEAEALRNPVSTNTSQDQIGSPPAVPEGKGLLETSNFASILNDRIRQAQETTNFLRELELLVTRTVEKSSSAMAEIEKLRSELRDLQQKLNASINREQNLSERLVVNSRETEQLASDAKELRETLKKNEEQLSHLQQLRLSERGQLQREVQLNAAGRVDEFKRLLAREVAAIFRELPSMEVAVSHDMAEELRVKVHQLFGVLRLHNVPVKTGDGN